MNVNRVKNQVLKIIFKYTRRGACAIFVFGSLAQNKIYPGSDIDIGVISGSRLENSTLVKIKQDLEQVETLRDIDIVDFSAVQDKDFLKTALREVWVWHQTKKSKVYLDNLKRRIAD